MTGPTCGLPACSSPCHAGADAGRYCAPARCYCRGCPAYVEVERGRPVTLAELERRRQAAVDQARRELAAATVRRRVDLAADGHQVTFAAQLVAA